MIILVLASINLMTRMIEKTNKRPNAEASIWVFLHHPTVLLVGRAADFDFRMQAAILASS